MKHVDLVLVLLTACVALQVLAVRFAVPHPSLLVLGGAALALVPGLPRPGLDPGVIFLIFVPPLLYRASVRAPLRELRRQCWPIFWLSVPLVLVTMVAVALVAHELIPALPWSAALVLGAIVSAPDAVAAMVQADATWSLVTFILESLVFILVGLDLQHLVQETGRDALGRWLGFSALITLVVIVVRMAWLWPVGAYARRALPDRHRCFRRPRQLALVAWAGIRGAESVVIALAVPHVTASGAAIPGRGLIVFATFGVVFATLVLQGLALKPLVRLLGLDGDTEPAREEAHARQILAMAGLSRLEELEGVGGGPPEPVDDLRRRHHHRARRWAAREQQLGGGSRGHAVAGFRRFGLGEGGLEQGLGPRDYEARVATGRGRKAGRPNASRGAGDSSRMVSSAAGIR